MSYYTYFNYALGTHLIDTGIQLLDVESQNIIIFGTSAEVKELMLSMTSPEEAATDLNVSIMGCKIDAIRTESGVVSHANLQLTIEH